MTDDNDEIKRFLESIPDKFQILDEGINIELQKEYLDYSDSFGHGQITDEEVDRFGAILFRPDVPDEQKKKGLTILAHVGTISAFKQLSKFYANADKQLKQWSALALNECKMFLESELLEESIGFISTGLGGTRDKLRIYFLVLPIDGKAFDPQKHKIIGSELSHVAKELNCEIENFDFQELYAGLTVLIPMDVAVATFIDKGIQCCNEFGNFVLEHYYAANTEIPDKKEIEEIIKIVREG
jgi:hypothetical protein